MFVDKIKYTDFDGNEREEEVRLNLSKNECRELELKYEDEGGLFKHLKNIIRRKNDGEMAIKPMYDFLKEVIELSYGIKSDDGKRFIKRDKQGYKLSYEFIDSACFDALMEKILSEDTDMEKFISAIFPKNDYTEEERKDAIEKTKKELGFKD